MEMKSFADYRLQSAMNRYLKGISHISGLLLLVMASATVLMGKGPGWSPPSVFLFFFVALLVLGVGAEVTRRVLSFCEAVSNLADSVTITDVRRTAAVFCEVAAVACIFLVFTRHRPQAPSIVGVLGLVGALLTLPEMKDQLREAWTHFGGNEWV